VKTKSEFSKFNDGSTQGEKSGKQALTVKKEGESRRGRVIGKARQKAKTPTSLAAPRGFLIPATT
jgi:hypothetical protein